MTPVDQTQLARRILRQLPRSPIPGQVLDAAAPLRLCGYLYEADSQPLDDRFMLDQASFSTDSNGGPVQVGDSIVWRGPAQGFDAPVLWAPARVVNVEPPSKGRQRVWSLQDTHAQPVDQLLVVPEGAYCQPEDASGCVVHAALPQVLRDELRDGKVELSGPMAEAVRHLFGQDDRCWRCGGILDQVVVGLVGPERQTNGAGRSSGNDRTVPGGCVVEGEDDSHRWSCRSCGASTKPSYLPLQDLALSGGVLLAWPRTQWATRLEAALSDARQPSRTTAVAASTGPDGPILSVHVITDHRERTATLQVRTGKVDLVDRDYSAS